MATKKRQDAVNRSSARVRAATGVKAGQTFGRTTVAQVRASVSGRERGQQISAAARAKGGRAKAKGVTKRGGY